jgi:hypothetical protein
MKHEYKVRFQVSGALGLLGLLSLAWLSCPAAGYSQAGDPRGAGEEFVGPFPSWANVRDYGAAGDGRADDTAAIQKALEAVRSKDSARRVLYFPTGVYRITATLKLDRISHSEPLGMSIAGEDPERTTLRWDGPAGGNMFRYNAWYTSLSRLTLDGAGKARVALQHGEAFTTGNEITDMIFKDVQTGIEAGMRDGIAETAVLRCRFYRCSKVAISIQNFNSLDWYIWNCWFEDCGTGVTNELGAGNFHVYFSEFLRSKDADISIRHTGYLSFVGNVSVASKQFFHAKRAANWKPTETWGSQVTLQDNLVLDTQDPTPIRIENNGPTLLLDNTIRTKRDGTVVWNEPPAGKADLICIGNTWSAAKPIRARGRVTDLDNKVVAAGEPAPVSLEDFAKDVVASDQILDVKTVPAPFLPRAERPVIVVAAGADAAAIQAAIDRAAALRGKRPVVHLPKGNYSIARTLVVPANCDLQLVGDGPENATQLSNAGAASPLIRVCGPSHATFRNLLVNAGKGAEAIRLENCDQPGSRIYGEQLNANGYEHGFVAEGLQSARVELRDAGHNSMQVIGAGPASAAWVALFCGASSRGTGEKEGISLYDVQNGGRLLVRDIWFEGNAYSMVNLKGSGEFAYHSGFMAPFDPNHGQELAWEKDLRRTVAALEANGFHGKLAFTLLSVSGGDLRVKPPSADLKFLLLGFLTNGRVDLGGAGVKGQVVAEHMRLTRTDRSGTDVAEGSGQSTPAFVREMLKPLREVKPRSLTAVKDDATDIRFYRVWANGRNGVRVQAAR